MGSLFLHWYDLFLLKLVNYLVFAALTLERVFMYDLNIDKYSRLAEQKPLKNPKYTNLAFNNRDPILLIGDNLGGVTLVKLSPVLTIGEFPIAI